MLWSRSFRLAVLPAAFLAALLLLGALAGLRAAPGSVLAATAPTGSLVINDGDAFAGNRLLTLNVSVTDDTMDETSTYEIALDGGAFSAPVAWGTDSERQILQDSTEGSGVKTVNLRYTGPAGSVTVSDTVTLDLDAPIVTMSIDAGAASFTDPLLALTISANDGTGAGPESMRFSQDGGATWTDPEPYATTKSLALPAKAGYGIKTVSVEVVDAVGHTGNASDSASYVSINRASMTLKTSYLFKTSLNYGTAKIVTTQTVTITNTSGGLLSKLNFSVPPRAFGEFSLGAVRVDGASAAAAWSNNANLVVTLGRNVRPGEMFTVSIGFTDTATSSISTSLRARLSKANGIMQVSQWFPIISDGHALRYPGDSQYTLAADKFRLELTYDRAMGVAAPGVFLSSTARSAVIEFGPARDFAFSVSPSYTHLSSSIDGIAVQVYYIRGTSGSTAMANAKAALHLFNVKFGKYPYSRFVVAQATRPGAGNEYPGIIFVGSSNLGSLSVVRHETAHQWFYGMLGNDQLNAPWLDEAFAQWAGDGFRSHSYCSSKKVSSSIYAFPNTPATSTSGSCSSYDQTIYFKGSVLIAGVRSRMGDTAFFASMKHLVSAYKYKVITTAIVANNFLAYTPSSKRSSLSTYMKAYISW